MYIQSIQPPGSVHLILKRIVCFRKRKSQNPKEKVKIPLRLPQSQVKINRRKLKVWLNYRDVGFLWIAMDSLID